MSDPVARTERWLHEIVIGMGLCPFARRPAMAVLLRYLSRHHPKVHSHLPQQLLPTRRTGSEND